MSKYHYNKDYFEKIESPNQAYWLGFLYADAEMYLDRKYNKYIDFYKDYDYNTKKKACTIMKAIRLILSRFVLMVREYV